MMGLAPAIACYAVVLFGAGLSGLYLSWYSYGGIVTHLGFGALAAATFATTAKAYVRIRQRDVMAHVSG
jgi:hypothetical protein